MALPVRSPEAANAVFDLGLTFHHEEIGLASLKKHGITLRDDVLALGEQRIRRHHSRSPVEYGPVAGGRRPQHRGQLSQRPRPVRQCSAARSRAFLPAKAPGTGFGDHARSDRGFYPDRNMHQGNGEMMPDPDVALSLRKITRRASERICHEAFKLALRRRRKSHRRA